MMTRIAWLIGALFAASLLAGASVAADKDYPIEDFERMTQCMSNPACSLEKEDRVDGAISDAGPYSYEGICLSGCIMLCTGEGCWCELDDSC